VAELNTIWTELQRLEFANRFYQVDDWNLRVIESGASAETILLLHGTGGHAEAFVKNIGPLARRYRVIVPDLGGHGMSSLAVGDLEIADYIAQVCGLIDLLELGPVHIQGESLGGWIAARLASSYPDRVNRLVLNTPGGNVLPADTMRTIRELTQAAADEPTRENVRRRLEWLMADPSSVTEELISVRQAIYQRPGFSESIRRVLCLQDPEIRQRNILTDEELQAIEAPTLLVWTDHNPTGDLAEGQRLASLIPGAELTVIKGAGHWPQWEQPEHFNRAVLEFLDRPA
jgi:2-hydroxy-6-oxonona-2,4-dienedioate hydrolase